MQIKLEHLTKRFGDTVAVNDLSITLESGKLIALLGPSGCGKTTTLNMISGILPVSGGSIFFDDRDVTSLPPEKRGIGLVFQNYALYPHMTVLQNICFPMEIQRIPKKERIRRAEELAEMVHITPYLKRKPAELSGGQQQRVAIARALATNPKVLLCDEATSALDPKTTRQILELIGDINKKLGITVVIITHQMSVVKEVCNHVAILDDGEVVEEGLVSTVFSAPKSAAARHLVFPRGADIDVSDPQQQRRIRLIFRSAKTTSIPLVARLATDEGISATVISANTQKLSEEVYGSMLLGVPNAQFEQAMDFLRGIENLQVEEASVDVQ